MITEPFTSKQLAERFKHSQSRIQNVLFQLKTENRVQNFKVERKDY